jgi:hypothetical protein
LFYDLSLKIYLRDIIAFGFLCLPLFLASFLKNDVIRQDIFKKLLLFIGLAFSLRVIFLDFSFFTQADALLYLANSPLVLFTALYLILSFGHCLAFFKSYGDLKWLMFFVSLSLLPMLAMAIDFQRASFLAIAVAVLSYGILLCVKTPMKMILPFVVLIIMVIFLFPYIEMIVENIAVKTSKVGLNMRYQEALAVWTIVSQHSWSLFFD